MPVLVCAKDQPLIAESIRIFLNLTTPAELMYSSLDVMQKTVAGRQTLSDLNKLLSETKKYFSDLRSIRAIVDYMKSILENDAKLSLSQCDSVSNCLTLLRNILYIPESHPRDDPYNLTKYQNEIIWNLFALNMDKLLMYLMSCSQRAFFSVTLAQLIALIFKDQHIKSLQKLMNTKLDDIFSEDSAEEFESNTPSKQEGDDSSPLITSDSSDNGWTLTKFYLKHRIESDFAYFTVTSKADTTNSFAANSDGNKKTAIAELSQSISTLVRLLET